MRINNHYKSISLLLILLSITSFFIGFFYGENSAGAGNYDGDFQTIWKNLQIFLNNDILSAITHSDYNDSRTPIAYILHKLFNPFLENKIIYRRSIFIISLATPLLFYFCLKQKFTKADNLLLLLISSTVFLSPYYRTTAYWGLEENYGYIFLLLTFLSLNSFLQNKKQETYKVYFHLLLITFLSSLCLYFDQKLIIIPIICLFKIIRSEQLTKFKLFSVFYYLIFSLPYFYLISLWGALIPSSAASARYLGEKLFLEHVGYSATIIAFYLLPLLLFKEKNLHNLIKNLFLSKKNYYLIFLFFIYLFCLINVFDFNEQTFLGKGYIHKVGLIFFEHSFLREFFTYCSFFISWIIILIYVDKNFKDILIIFYFFILSVILWPVLQEYFDPLILLMSFTFFSSKLFITYKNSIILFCYLLFLLIGSNFYYSNLLG